MVRPRFHSPRPIGRSVDMHRHEKSCCIAGCEAAKHPDQQRCFWFHHGASPIVMSVAEPEAKADKEEAGGNGEPCNGRPIYPLIPWHQAALA